MVSPWRVRFIQATMLFLAVAGAGLYVRTQGVRLRATVMNRADPMNNCEGLPFFTNYAFSGSAVGPFDCSFQCDPTTEPQKYYLVYNNIDKGTGNLYGAKCSKNPGCSDYGEDHNEPCNSGIAAVPAPMVQVHFRPYSSSSSSAATACPALASVLGADARRTDPGDIIEYLHGIQQDLGGDGQSVDGLDVDGNGIDDAKTDGVLLQRYFNGLTGNALTDGAIGAAAARKTPQDITEFIGGKLVGDPEYYDIDFDAQILGATDGVLITRYLQGDTGGDLTAAACTTDEQAHCTGAKPVCTPTDAAPCYVCSAYAASSSSSSSSSRSSSSFSSSSSSASYDCAGYICTEDDIMICAPYDADCVPADTDTCFTCTYGSSSQIECAGDGCATGGDMYCSHQGEGMQCEPTDHAPCFHCIEGDTRTTPHAASSEHRAAPQTSSENAFDGGKNMSNAPSSAAQEPSILASSAAQQNAPGLALAAECTGTACAGGGDRVCGKLGLRCSETDAQPCMVCVGEDGAVAQTTCGGDACAVGGEEVCRQKGGLCEDTQDAPCFRCVEASVGMATACGNGVLNIGEACDAGAANGQPGSFCSSQCTLVPACGNSGIDEGEECDDGPKNGTLGDSCDALCKLASGIVPRCGDGILEAGEQCDDGSKNGSSGDTCLTSCVLHPVLLSRCGDGVLQQGEQCDDAERNGTPGDGCTASCDMRPGLLSRCGDGVLQQGEDCDLGKMNGTPLSTCGADCRLRSPKNCGNGRLDAGETCDDGNTRDGDGCSMLCHLERGIVPRCGDGILEPGEQCDDGSGNGARFGSCSVLCRSTGPIGALTAALITQGHAAAGATGPEVAVVIAVGASAGFAFVRRKRKIKD